MNYIKHIIEDALAAFACAMDKWSERRYLRSGGNPDVLPF